MDAMALENPGRLFTILDRSDRVRAVIWGHIHQVFESERRGVLLLGSPSTCVQFKPGADDYLVDDLAPGFRELLLLPDGSIETTVIRLAAE